MEQTPAGNLERVHVGKYMTNIYYVNWMKPVY